MKPQPSIPVLANEALATNFNLESISNGQVNDILVSDELPCITNEQISNESGYREADLRLCFRICKNPGFSQRGSYYFMENLLKT